MILSQWNILVRIHGVFSPCALVIMVEKGEDDTWLTRMSGSKSCCE